jgi:hypothetical protein
MIAIAKLVEIVNRRNRVSTCSAKMRAGWNDLLEHILMLTDTYGGYRYLTDVPTGHKPGYAKDQTGKNIFPDETRREYYVRET